MTPEQHTNERKQMMLELMNKIIDNVDIMPKILFVKWLKQLRTDLPPVEKLQTCQICEVDGQNGSCLLGLSSCKWN